MTFFRVFAILAVGIFGYKMFFRPEERRYKSCTRTLKREYKGIVTNIIVGGGRSYVLNNKHVLDSRHVIYFWSTCNRKYRLDTIVEMNDSIVKPKGTFDYYIYKNANPDSLIYLPCDYQCEGILLDEKRN